MLKDVVKEGTDRRARVLGRNDLAGKTGTTNNQQDAWFSGFNRNMVCVTWVGFDDHSPLGTYETGSRVALPIWIDFMRSTGPCYWCGLIFIGRDWFFQHTAIGIT